ncbi:hypothetical protein LXL04_001028 [Taraxacum kok-saghyz]
MGNVSLDTLMSDFLQKSGGVAVIDGGLATELERYGADLNDPLWSAKCLLTSTHLIRQVHLDYLEAGADILITASYQATIQGFEAKGYSSEDGESMLKKSVEIAHEARDAYYERCCESSSDCTDDEEYGKLYLITWYQSAVTYPGLSSPSSRRLISSSSSAVSSFTRLATRRPVILFGSSTSLHAFRVPTADCRLDRALPLLLRVPTAEFRVPLRRCTCLPLRERDLRRR